MFIKWMWRSREIYLNQYAQQDKFLQQEYIWKKIMSSLIIELLENKDEKLMKMKRNMYK